MDGGVQSLQTSTAGNFQGMVGQELQKSTFMVISAEDDEGHKQDILQKVYTYPKGIISVIVEKTSNSNIPNEKVDPIVKYSKYYKISKVCIMKKGNAYTSQIPVPYNISSNDSNSRDCIESKLRSSFPPILYSDLPSSEKACFFLNKLSVAPDIHKSKSCHVIITNKPVKDDTMIKPLRFSQEELLIHAPIVDNKMRNLPRPQINSYKYESGKPILCDDQNFVLQQYFETEPIDLQGDGETKHIDLQGDGETEHIDLQGDGETEHIDLQGDGETKHLREGNALFQNKKECEKINGKANSHSLHYEDNCKENSSKYNLSKEITEHSALGIEPLPNTSKQCTPDKAPQNLFDTFTTRRQEENDEMDLLDKIWERNTTILCERICSSEISRIDIGVQTNEELEEIAPNERTTEVQMWEERIKKLENSHAQLIKLRAEMGKLQMENEHLIEDLNYKMNLQCKNEETIHDMRKDLSVTQHQGGEKDVMIASMSKQVKNVKAKLENAFNAIKERETAIIELKEKRTQLEVSLTSSTVEKIQVDGTLCKLKEDLNQVSSRYFRMKHDIAAKDKENKSLAKENANLNGKLATIMNSTTNDEVQELQSKLQKYEEQMSQLTADHVEEIETLKATLTVCNREKIDGKNALKMNIEELNFLKEEIGLCQKKVLNYEEHLVNKEKLEEKNQELLKMCSSLEEELMVLRCEKEEFTEVKKYVEHLKASSLMERESNSGYKSKCNELQEELSRLQNNFEVERELLNNELKKIRSECDKVRTDKFKLSEIFQGKESEVQSLVSKNEGLLEALFLYQREMEIRGKSYLKENKLHKLHFEKLKEYKNYEVYKLLGNNQSKKASQRLSILVNRIKKSNKKSTTLKNSRKIVAEASGNGKLSPNCNSIENLEVKSKYCNLHLEKNRKGKFSSLALLKAEIQVAKETETSLREELKSVLEQCSFYQQKSDELREELNSSLSLLQSVQSEEPSLTLRNIPSPSRLDMESLLKLLERCSEKTPSASKCFAGFTEQLGSLGQEICALQQEIESQNAHYAPKAFLSIT